MSRKSLDDSQPVIFKCALLITAFSSPDFTTRDVMFHVDLVKNLFRPSNHFADFNLQPLQVIRLFEKYAEDGWAMIRSEGKNKSFNLTPKGFLGIIESLVTIDYILPTSEAVFLQWLLENYGSFVSREFDPKLDEGECVKLKTYVTPGYVFRRQLELMNEGKRDMEYRIRESHKLLAYLDQCRKDNLSPGEAFLGLPSQYSYQLSHQRSLQSWLDGLPEDIQAFEYEKGVSIRQQKFYQRTLDALESTRSFYEAALKDLPPA